MMTYILAIALGLMFVGRLSLVVGANDVCRAYVYPGAGDVDIKIAAVLGIHESDDDRCSNTYNTGALQNAIALNYAAHLLNGNNRSDSFIPGVRIGIEVYDDCNTKYLAASHAGALGSQVRGITGCPTDSSMSSLEIPTAGVIGTSISYTTTILARVLQTSYIPVMGPSATVSELSDKSKYPNFIRVVPSDLKQAKVIVKLAKYFSWSYIVGVSTSDNYGTEGMAELKKLANDELICVSMIPNFDLFNEDDMMKFVRTTLVDKIGETKGNLGIVYFGLNPPLIRFLKYIEKKRSSWNKSDFQKLRQIYWVASDAVEVSPELARHISQYFTNILVVSPYLVNLGSFEQYFIDFLKNPPLWTNGEWKSALSNVVRTNLRCSSYDLAVCNIHDYLVFDSYIPSVLDALYLLVNSLKTIHYNTCKGKSGACNDFKTILNNGLLKHYNITDLNYSDVKSEYVPPEFSTRQLQNVSGDFEVINQPLYSLKVTKNGNFIKAADFERETITMFPEFTTIFGSSECNTTCKECLYIEESNYLFHPGDILFLGLFSIHWPSQQGSYKCGSYREKSMSYIAMEAFINAVYVLSNRTSINFGYIIVNDCYNALTVTKLINEVMTGDIKLQNLNGGKTINASKVVVAIGAQSSHVTMAALPILTELNIPMISYRATNPNLDNRIMYPYFSRTVSSDYVQARAFVEIVKKLEVTYVGTVVVKNSYGLELYKLFRSFAESEKICVDEPVKVTELTTIETYSSVLNDYKNRRIQVIVIIAMDKIVTNFFGAVKNEDIFVFIGSEAWGPNVDIINHENNKKARGSLVLGAASPQLKYGLEEHLRTLDPFSNTSTVWLRDFWQDQFSCDMPGGFRNTHEDKTCDNKTLPQLDLILDNLVNSPLAVHATMATMSAGFTVSSLLNNKKQMRFSPIDFTNTLHSIKLMSSTGEFKPYLESGNGDFGFDIYNVQQSINSGGRYKYVNVGSYRSNTGLSLNKSMIKFYGENGQETKNLDSSCLYHSVCEKVCSGFQPSSNPESGSVTPVTGKQGGSQTSSRDTVVIILAILLGLFVLIVIILLVLGVLAYIGKVHFKGRHSFTGTNKAVYNTMSSGVTFSKVHNNSYSNPHDSSCSDIRPQLPARNTNENNITYTSKAFSDIVSPSQPAAAESIQSRDRANSLPTISHYSTTKHQQLKSPKSETLFISEQCLPVGHTFQQASSSAPQIRDEVEQLRDKGNNGLGLQQFGDQNIGNNLYNGLYRNIQNNMIHSPKYPQEPIIFQNVSQDGAIYTLATPLNNSQKILAGHPQSGYVYVQTREGIMYIPYQDFQVWLNSLHDQPNSTLLVADRSVKSAAQAVINSVDINNYLISNNIQPKDYIIPIDVVYNDTGRTLENPTGIRFSSEDASHNCSLHDPTTMGSQSNNNTKFSATQLPLKSCNRSTHVIDSNNYMIPLSNAHLISLKGNEVMLNPQGHNMVSSNSDTFPLSSSYKQPLMDTIQQPNHEFRNTKRPDSLAVGPVYVPGNQLAPQLFSQGQFNSPVGLHMRHLPVDSMLSDNIQNKNRIIEAQVDDCNTSVMPSVEEHMRRQRDHNSPSRIVLSLLKEEPEEMV